MIAQTALPVRERLIPVLWPSAGGEFEARDGWRVVSSVIGEHLPLDDRDGHHDEEQDHRHGAGIAHLEVLEAGLVQAQDRKSTRLNSSHVAISYAVFCLKKKKE